MNNVILMGRLTKDPDVKENCTRFSIAVNRDFKNSDGNYDADFINCVCFKKTAEFVGKYFHKGNRILLTGRIQTGSYTNRDGNKVNTTDIVVEKAEFVETKSQRSEAQPEPQNNFVDLPAGIDEELPFN